MFSLSKISLANRSIVALLAVAILIVGGFTIPALKQEFFPSISFPAVTVVTTYPGAAPAIVERDITGPLEQSFQGIKGLETMTSYSNESASVLVLSYEYGTDLDKASQDLTQRVNKLQSILPANTTPMVQTFNISDQPIVRLAISSDQQGQALADQINKEVVPALEHINGVGSVTVSGVRNQIVRITLDPGKLQAYGLSATQIQGVIQANNTTLPVGSVSNDGSSLTIKAGTTLTSLDDLKNLLVGSKSTSGNAAAQGEQTSPPIPVFLKDVATVDMSSEDATSITRTNGQDSLGISLVKTSSGNTVEISHEVQKLLKDLENKLGNNAKIVVIGDQAPMIESSINDLIREGVIGAIFAIIVILLFLFSIRSTIVTAISIPLSVVIALIGLYVGNYTLNLLTLGGLTIAVGRVVDDSIVVLENIYRHLQRGEEKKAAILAAVKEVSTAVTASTLTTVAVFLPIAFTGSLVGEVFRSFSVAVTIALLASLLVSLTIIPVLAYWFLKAPKAKAGQKVEEHKDGWLERGYTAMVGWVTGRGWQRAVTIVLALIVLGGSFALTPLLQTNLFGSASQGTYNVGLAMAPGTSLSKTNDAAKQIENTLVGMKDEVDIYQVTIGSGGGALASLSGGAGGSASASVTVTTKAGIDQAAFEKKLRDQLGQLNTGGTVTVGASSGGFSNSKLQVDVKASNDQTLRDATQQVQDEVKNASGLVDVESNLSDAVPQIDVQIDPLKASMHGISSVQVAQALRGVYSGTTVTKITLNGKQQDIKLFVGTAASTIEDIKNLPISTPLGNVSLKDLANVEEVNGPTQITHIDSERTASVTATITDSNVGAVSADVQKRIDGLDLPDGASVTLGGITADQQDTFSNLGMVVAVAILLVYCIMVATFRSLIQPLLLLVAIPFAATGSLILLLLTNTPLGAPALIGFLMLVGIVVTNAIVLLDLVRQYREQGLSPREAVIEGGRRRLRPILMTAIATILALMPMVLEVGGSSSGGGGFISGPLAIVVIGGLTTSTILTLLLVPTLYVLTQRNKPGTPPVEPAKEIDEERKVEVSLA